ncbi:LytR C-terminal domain-containing protein [Isoptericola sp. 4D.3]|uniref:LytR C-terminal domain-containing protein n=1 Tax=Isoptericola peretonis TaxID=2918523 RepID=A0ABT0J598_9MICO|nr:LytR C-terminal domain-containing protein [Isoptericola sp. 4D.3]
MSKSHYPYPPDEFDVRGPEGTPVGVHREPRSGWSSVWPFLLVAVVCGGIAVGAVSFLSDDGDPTPPAAEQSAGAGAEEPEASPTAEAEGDEPPADGETSEEPADEGEEEPADESTELPGDPAAANLEASVMVFNDGAGAGQAAAGQGVLTGDGGFVDVAATDAPDDLRGAYEDTTVLYGADRADTASAVAEALGVDPANVQESDDVTASEQAVWVVLKSPVG